MTFAPIDLSAIVVQFITTAGILLGAGIPAYRSLKKRQDATAQNTEIIKSETRNAHDPDRPMRHDIDELLSGNRKLSKQLSSAHAKIDRQQIQLDAMSSVQESHGGELAGVRRDVRTLHESDKDLWKAVFEWRKKTDEHPEH